MAALRGEASDPTTFSGKYFDEKAELQRCLDAKDNTTYGIAMVLKLVHAVLFQDNVHAIRFSDLARPYLKNLTASALLPLFYFYDSLARLASYREHVITSYSIPYTKLYEVCYYRLLASFCICSVG